MVRGCFKGAVLACKRGKQTAGHLHQRLAVLTQDWLVCRSRRRHSNRARRGWAIYGARIAGLPGKQWAGQLLQLPRGQHFAAVTPAAAAPASASSAASAAPAAGEMVVAELAQRWVMCGR